MECIVVDVERGFTTSPGEDWGLPGEKPTENDFGEF